MSWSDIWKGMGNVDFLKGREPYVWKYYERLLLGYDFRGKKVLEFGCGTGINTTIMALRGAKVTFVDYSKEALDLVRQNLDRLGVDAELIRANVFDFRENGRWDLVHSEGLVEHYLPPKRQEIVDIHAGAVKKGGRVLIIVPHIKCPPYRIGKRLGSMLGCWIYGNEYPYTRNELVKRMHRAGLEPGRVVGGQFLFSLFFMFAPIAFRSRRMLRKGTIIPARPRWARLNDDNYFANRWGRIIGCVGTKTER
jgi:SAM-dependent methyltransferase